MRGKKKYGQNYLAIYNTILKLGHTQLDNLLLNNTEADLYSLQYEDQKKIYRNAIRLIREADVIVLEVSEPSISMGYVMNFALELNKPTILLHVKNQYPIFVTGIKNDNLHTIEYTLHDLQPFLASAFIDSSAKRLIRYNLFITPEQDHHLNKMSRFCNKPKSVYLRSLIDDDMKSRNVE